MSENIATETEPALSAPVESTPPVTAPAPTPAVETRVAASEPNLRYSEEDLRLAREQEKSKVYSRMEKMSEELRLLKESETQRQAEEEARRAHAEAEEQARIEQEMDVRALLEKRDAEWQSKWEAMEAEREQERALLDRERQYSELQAYTAQRIEQERDNILPELLDLVTGNTKEEIDASIESLKVRSDRIFNAATEAIGQSRPAQQGPQVTLPPTLDSPSENRQFTADDISQMSMAEYAKYRQHLLSQQAQGRSQGLFG